MAAELLAGAGLLIVGVVLIVFRRSVAGARRELNHRYEDPRHGLLNVERGQREQDLYKGPADAAERLGVAAVGAILVAMGAYVVVQAL